MKRGVCIHPFNLQLDFQDHDGPGKFRHHVSLSQSLKDNSTLISIASKGWGWGK